MSKRITLLSSAPERRAGDLGPLVKEMLAGADDRAPFRPGRYLETPQPLGFLPTLHFWNRRDVGKSARWLTGPVTGVSMLTTAVVATMVEPWLFPLVGLACGMPVVLAHGLLERYVRKRLRERRQLESR
jgi:hypothetical protein